MEISPEQAAIRLTELGYSVPDDVDTSCELDEIDIILIGNLGTARSGYVLPGTLSQAANEAGCTLPTAAARLKALGFLIPLGFLTNAKVDEVDQWLAEWLVSWADTHFNSQLAVLKILVTAAWTFERTFSDLAERMRALRCDRSVFSEIADTPSGEIPLAWMLDAAQWANENPQRMVERLTALGFSSFPATPPPNWSDSLNTQLVGRLDLREPVSVSDVLRAALDLRMTIKDIVNRLTSLGLEVPDMAAELPPLLARVPFKS